MKKSFSIFMCLVLTLVFCATPILSMAETTTTKEAGTKTTTTSSSSKTTTTKKATSTTKKTTTKATSNNSSGKLSVSSKRSTTSTGTNGKVTIIYTINNTGSVTAKNLKLKDADIAGAQVIETIDSLSAGESKTVEYEATMTRDSESTPVITCTMNGSSRTFTGDTVKIAFKDAASLLSATLTSTTTEIQPNTPVKFSLVLKNDDSSQISDITISDYTGKAIKSGISLNAGSTTNVEFELTLIGNTNVYVNVKGKTSNGQEVTAKSNELAIKSNENAVTVEEGISILVHANKTLLEKAEEITLTLEIKNLMPKPYTNVTIIDKSTGANLQTISLLTGNDSKVYTSKVKIEQNTSFLYEVKATYQDGTAVTVQSNSLEITINKKNFTGGMIIIAIIVGVVILLIIATSITLYILSKKEKEKQKSIGAAQSEKYRKTAPKKKSSPAPTRQPISTFTIDEDEDNQTDDLDTSAFQVPPSNDAFDNYGNENAFDMDEQSNSNKEQHRSEPTYNDLYDDENDESTSSFSKPATPPSGEPMNYNDLDPD